MTEQQADNLANALDEALGANQAAETAEPCFVFRGQVAGRKAHLDDVLLAERDEIHAHHVGLQRLGHLHPIWGLVVLQHAA